MIAHLLAALISTAVPVYTETVPTEDVTYNVVIFPFRDDDGDFIRDEGEVGVGAYGTISWPGGEMHWDADHGVAALNVPPGNRVTVDGGAIVPEWYECYPIQTIDTIPLTGSTRINFPCAPTTIGQMIPMWVQRLLK